MLDKKEVLKYIIKIAREDFLIGRKGQLDGGDEKLEELGKLHFRSELDGDDLDLIEMFMDLEDKYEIEIQETAPGQKDIDFSDPTLDQLANLVVRLAA